MSNEEPVLDSIFQELPEAREQLLRFIQKNIDYTGIVCDIDGGRLKARLPSWMK